MRHLIILNGIWPWPGQNSSWAMNRGAGAYQIKHWLSKFGFKVQVIDFCQVLTVTEIKMLLEQFIDTDTFSVGFSTTYWPKDAGPPANMMEAIQYLRDKHPRLKLIGGGSAQKSYDSFFDKTFVGTSENEIVVWCQEQIKKTGRSMFNEKFDITKLDHRFDLTDCIDSSEVLPIELGRGCIFKCKFCAHPNLGKSKFTYQRKFDLIVDELKYNKDMFGTTGYNFMDDTVNEDVEKTENLASLPKRLGFDIVWNGYLRADLVWARKPSPDQLYQSGMRSCFFGIETFHKGAGKSIDKGWGAKHGRDYLPKLYADLWNKEINIRTNFIIGLPGESLQSSRETLEWCMEQDYGMSQFSALEIYKPNPGEIASEFSKSYAEHGYKINGNGVKNINWWTSDQMSYGDAIAASREFNRALGAVNKITSWPLFSMMSLGFDLNTIRHLKIDDLRKLPFVHVHKFKTQYVKRLMALKE